MDGKPTREYNNRRYVYASVNVPTVDRGLPCTRSWLMTTLAEIPCISSTFGRLLLDKYLRANDGSDSKYWRCPSRAMISKAMVDFPDPETPTKHTIFPRGITTSMCFKLFSDAPMRVIAPFDTVFIKKYHKV